ncbi:type II toxin-antitoxin system RelB/DinJ family antitoxin [Kosakonia radicincitans]|uniref:type II toxin-antitoxin system RelB/DinJ family antitoxin n=1 Tax=Kosakonia radicincitans TaxID=283686 RepID=UPI0023680D05|nr:type II toxin-antitoxin system RelB/DinJ family antitoxin [Kosakonia radicincitans]MDD7998261.1 type II toxin-antitoxin system RelB/DinJ family antitoxin [Kosakonia radicincitans]
MPLVNIRIDDELKAEADVVYKELNITATEAITQLYRFVVQYRRLPFNDPYWVLLNLKEAVSKAADQALKLNNAHLQGKAISKEDVKKAKRFFDGTNRLLEDNYDVVRSAWGGYIPQPWVNVANAMKGLSYMVSMNTTEQHDGVFIDADIHKAYDALQKNYIEISVMLESLNVRH